MQRQEELESRTGEKGSAVCRRSNETGVSGPREGVDIHTFREEGGMLARVSSCWLLFFFLRSHPY